MYGAAQLKAMIASSILDSTVRSTKGQNVKIKKSNGFKITACGDYIDMICIKCQKRMNNAHHQSPKSKVMSSDILFVATERYNMYALIETVVSSFSVHQLID